MKRTRPEGISPEEAQLYDRQIRLWGAASQQKIQEARVLLAGLTGTGAELAKNLVLAGVGHLTLFDQTVVTAGDLGANFFLEASSVGLGRAESSLAGLCELNPRVDVAVSGAPLAEMDLAGFDLVVCCSDDLATSAALNRQCRAANRPFFAAGADGFQGYIFADVSGHLYCLEGAPKDQKTMPEGLLLKALYSDPLPVGGRRVSASMLALQQRWLRGEAAKAPGLAPVCAVLGGVAGQQAIRILTHVGRPIDNIFVYDALAHVGKVETMTIPK